ncbi:hypothetical protein OY671_011411, partial [Metschnikowia pulcherrima]
DGARSFFRKPEANTWGILNVREQFSKDNPKIVQRVLAVYEEARKYSLANYDELKKGFIAVTKSPETVVDKQLKEPPARAPGRERREQDAPPMALKHYRDLDVHEAAKARIRSVFQHFERVCAAFSGGKDSSVTSHSALEVAREMGRGP